MIKVENNTIYVVMYHYVHDNDNYIIPNLNSLRIKEFLRQINLFKKKFNILNFYDFKEILDTKQIPKKPSVLLTFDDGSLDHYKNVFPILLENKITGIFYPPIKTIENKILLDVNKIHIILALEKNRDNLIKIINVILNENFNKTLDHYNLKNINKISPWDDVKTNMIKRVLQYILPQNIRTIVLDQLFAKIVKSSDKEISKHFYMNEKNVKEMLQNGMFFGSHGNYHYYWEFLSKRAQEEEIIISKNFFHKKFNISNDEFSVCYPYGSYNTFTIDLLKKMQINFAFDCTHGIIDMKNIEKKYQIQRVDTNLLKI